jgi:drug/metabolite transporter (DMT)-like permease
VAAVVLALCAAALWGAGDFLGGFASRRTAVLVVLFWSQLAGLLGLVVWVLSSGAALPGVGSILAALGAGLAGIVGLGCLYRGMAVGAMGIVAPISATSPAVPLVVDLARGRSPGTVQWIGIVVALAGVVLLSREPGAGRAPVLAAGAGLALAAALGFGVFLVGIGAAAQESAAWAATTARFAEACTVVLVLAATGTSARCSRRLLPVVVAVGVFDAGANALIALAAARGAIGIVAVLSSLYPVMTILLARAVLHERLGPTRAGGGLIAIAGAALIASG